jgi:hypothetical protein
MKDWKDPEEEQLTVGGIGNDHEANVVLVVDLPQIQGCRMKAVVTRVNRNIRQVEGQPPPWQ